RSTDFPAIFGRSWNASSSNLAADEQRQAVLSPLTSSVHTPHLSLHIRLHIRIPLLVLRPLQPLKVNRSTPAVLRRFFHQRKPHLGRVVQLGRLRRHRVRIRFAPR